MSWRNGQDSNGHEGRKWKWARLDRALVNISFLNKYHPSQLTYLMRRSSNHKPMLMNAESMDHRYGPLPFRFQNMWSYHEKFLHFVHEMWVEQIPRSSIIKLVAKLKKSNVILKQWPTKTMLSGLQNFLKNPCNSVNNMPQLYYFPRERCIPSWHWQEYFRKYYTGSRNHPFIE